jgi:3-keto-disaccharide hydrolase
MSFIRSFLIVLCVVLLAGCSAPAVEEVAQVSPDDFAGRWDIKVQSAAGSYPSWLELTREGEQFTGRFVGQVGHARPVSDITVAGDTVTFTLPKQYEQMDTDLSFTGKLAEGTLSGTTNTKMLVPGELAGEAESDAPAEAEAEWSAVRAPELAAPEAVEWAEPVALFNGKDLDGWKLWDPEMAGLWKVKDGILINDVEDQGDVGQGTGLISEQDFENFKLHLEFMYPEGSNSGIYLRGRHEVQIQDDFGKEPGDRLIAGVYGFITPTENTAKKAGEWQTMDITLLGRFITIVLNDVTVIDNQEIPGITGGALDCREGEPGPLFIQGDHGPISFRSVELTPAI